MKSIISSECIKFFFKTALCFIETENNFNDNKYVFDYNFIFFDFSFYLNIKKFFSF